MSEEIKVGRPAISAAADLLRQDMEAFCSFRLQPLFGVLPTRGSADHDGRLARLVEQATGSFADLVEADVATVETLGDAVAGADRRSAAAIETS